MANTVAVEGVSKFYRLGTITSKTAWKDLHAWLTHGRDAVELMAEATPSAGMNDDEAVHYIWALRDVSFVAGPGEVIGIIGRNGAGKSTLLKILSRITAPTRGAVKIRGRLASLLEIGTGFHPELTGRENIFLNGSILGMRVSEIRKRFDEIVEFAEIGEFIDTPVKRYSSGMHMRLAFSVAAHLETDILVVDEVLAVGDIAFQQKCLNKISDAGGSGRTVLFVSHRMDHVTSLCQRSILLSHGRMMFDGLTAETMTRYYELFEQEARESLRIRSDRTGSGRVKFVDAWASNGRRQRMQTLTTGDDIFITLRLENQGTTPVTNLIVDAELYSFGNMLAAAFSTRGSDPITIDREVMVEFAVPRLSLNAGLFSLTCRVHHADGYDEDLVDNAISITVDFGDFHGIGQSSGGFLSIPHKARIIPSHNAA